MKQFGIYMMAAAAVYLGWTAAETEETRYRSLRQVEQMLSLLSDEIRCSLSTFDQVFLNVSQRLDEPWKGFLKDMAETLNSYSGKSFRQIWETGVDGLPMKCGLSGDDLKELKMLGTAMGYLDAQVQTAAIRNFITGWEYRLEDTRGNLKDHQRIYRALGISAGLMVLVVWL